ncbi:MAG TPA: cobalt transporter CbiM [Thioalkalivibrio sp.]|nr:cobalt transporter CbiM [Thioalkalivibrio sp.]
MPDGVLSAPVLLTGAVVTASALVVALRRLEYEQIPRAAVLSAAFFVSSLITVPVGPSSVHLVLNGLMGLVLGWAAVPAILVALVLQAAFFGFGGLLVLGVNTMNIALPALLCSALFGAFLGRYRANGFVIGALAGMLGITLTGLMVALSLGLSDPAYSVAAKVILATYAPLLLVEAVVTGAIVGFLWRVAPELLFAMDKPDE